MIARLNYVWCINNILNPGTIGRASLHCTINMQFVYRIFFSGLTAGKKLDFYESKLFVFSSFCPKIFMSEFAPTSSGFIWMFSRQTTIISEKHSISKGKNDNRNLRERKKKQKTMLHLVVDLYVRIFVRWNDNAFEKERLRKWRVIESGIVMFTREER